MFDLTDHQLTTISTWAEVAIILFMVWEKYGPAWGTGHLTPFATLAHGGVRRFLWENRTLWVAILGLGFIGWLYLWRGVNTTAVHQSLPSDTAKLNELTGQVISLKSKLDAKTIELDAVQHTLLPVSPPIDVLSAQHKNLFMGLGNVFGGMRVHQSELLAMAMELSKTSGGTGVAATNFYVPPCQIIVSSAKENQNFAKFIEIIAQSQQCQANDAPAPPPPPRPVDADKPPPKPTIIPDPLPYIVVRYPNPEDIQNLPEPPDTMGIGRFRSVPSQEINDKTAKFRDQIADKLMAALQDCGLDARRSRKAEGSPGRAVDKWTIYIDLGSVQICR